MSRLLLTRLLVILVALSCATLATAQNAVPSQALLEDATEYAAAVDVELEEAVRRLRLQDEIGRLDGFLYREMRESFAGLWIEHTPDFRVVVRFATTANAAGRTDLENVIGKSATQRLLAETRLSRRDLASLLVFRPAERSIAELEDAQAAANHVLRSQGLRFDSEINLAENRVDLFTLDTDLLKARLQPFEAGLPSEIEVIATDGLLETEQAALVGGASMSTCTVGFNVRRNSDNELGTLTAAHCGNSQTVLGVSLPFRAQDISGNQDVQWHSACDLLDVTDDFNSGIGIRDVTGTRNRNNQTVGTLVCKFGRTTGRTCGFIESTSVAPSSAVTSPQSTFVRVGDGGADLSAGGDSGGPWFVETLAYGIHHGGYNSGTHNGDAVYMPINYISSLGVSVLTADPGNCNISTPPPTCVPGASCSGHDDCGGTSQGFCQTSSVCVCPF